MASKLSKLNIPSKIFQSDYGRNIIIISQELFLSTIKEKRYYLSVFYFILTPLFFLLIGNVKPAIQTGTGIALFQSQSTTLTYIELFYMSFFLGQIMLVILSADVISGEMEQETFPLLRSKPIYDSEIIFGKFLGILGVLMTLVIPTLLIIYFSNMVKFKAKYPSAYIETIDEIVVAIFVVILLQSVVISLTFLASSIFNRSLYSILSSMLGLFIISQISNVLSSKSNYLSFSWLLNVIIPKVFYHLEPVTENTPSLLTFIMGLIITILSFLFSSIIILRNKELN